MARRAIIHLQKISDSVSFENESWRVCLSPRSAALVAFIKEQTLLNNGAAFIPRDLLLEEQGMFSDGDGEEWCCMSERSTSHFGGGQKTDREKRRWTVRKGRQVLVTHQLERQWLILLQVARSAQALQREMQLVVAFRVLRALFLPVWRRSNCSRRRKQVLNHLEAALWVCLDRPTEALLDGRAFFELWPMDARRRLVSCLYPVQFEGGDFMMLQGDPGDRMYFVISGSVDIIIQKKGPCKSRARHNGFVVATLGPGVHLGEFALVNDEPRMASVQCTEPTTCWALRKVEFQAELQQFRADDPLRLSMAASILKRRAEVMSKLYPLTVKQLLGISMFAQYPAEALAAVAAAVEPLVVPAGHVLFAEGSAASCMYFVARGRIQLWKRAAAGARVGASGSAGLAPDDDELLATLRRGNVFGEVGVVTLQPQPYTARAAELTDLWRLPRVRCREFLQTRPVLFRRVKELINVQWAAWIDPLPPEALASCGPLWEAVGESSAPVREVVHALLVPQVAGPGDVLVCDGVLFVTKGALVWLQRSAGRRVGAGEAVGVERLADSALPTGTLRAATAVEGWLLPFAQLTHLTQRGGMEAALSSRVRGRRLRASLDRRLRLLCLVLLALGRMRLLVRRRLQRWQWLGAGLGRGARRPTAMGQTSRAPRPASAALSRTFPPPSTRRQTSGAIAVTTRSLGSLQPGRRKPP